MSGFTKNIEGIFIKNYEVRRVFYTVKHRQPVVLAVEIGAEYKAESCQMISMNGR